MLPKPGGRKKQPKSRPQANTPVVKFAADIGKAVLMELQKQYQPSDELSSIAGRLIKHDDPEVQSLAGYVLARDLTRGKRLS